jgi:hypothetical protein
MQFESRFNDPATIIAETDFILFKRSGIHGTGGFAKTAIPSDTEIIEYVGERITKAESLVRCELNNAYIFDLDDEHDLDGSVDWNLARFLNHSCTPNCEALESDGRIWITTCRGIAAGDELTFNYGYDLQDYREHPCRCGAANCAGYIVAEEFMEQVRQQAAFAAGA